MISLFAEIVNRKRIKIKRKHGMGKKEIKR